MKRVLIEQSFRINCAARAQWWIIEHAQFYVYLVHSKRYIIQLCEHFALMHPKCVSGKVDSREHTTMTVWLYDILCQYMQLSYSIVLSSKLFHTLYSICLLKWEARAQWVIISDKVRSAWSMSDHLTRTVICIHSKRENIQRCERLPFVHPKT